LAGILISVSELPTIHQAKQNLLNECNPDFSPIDKNGPKIALVAAFAHTEYLFR